MVRNVRESPNASCENYPYATTTGIITYLHRPYLTNVAGQPVRETSCATIGPRFVSESDIFR